MTAKVTRKDKVPNKIIGFRTGSTIFIVTEVLGQTPDEGKYHLIGGSFNSPSVLLNQQVYGLVPIYEGETLTLTVE
jgi:ribose 5-phosphate isomerase